MSTALWVVYEYEVGMFNQMLRFGTTVECQKFPQPIQNAIVESMLLHLRILVDILLSRGSGDDDINLTDLLPGFKSSLVARLKTAYGDSKTVGCPCWHLNKRLAHPTQIRSSSYNYDHVLHALGPLVMQLLDEIAAARQVSP
jgi:hypothetical protein